MSSASILLFCNRNLTFGRLWVALTICFVMLCVAGTFYLLPKVYASRALILMPEDRNDAHQVHALLQQIQSRKVLEPVIDELNLTAAALAGEAKVTGEAKEAAYVALRRMIELRSRDSGLMEVRVYSENPELTAKIANKITEVARRIEGTQLSLVEPATPAPRRVRPNVPLNLVLGAGVSLLAAAALAGLARLTLGGRAQSARPV
jgi:capsular polysaccharide biosynthesis protein